MTTFSATFTQPSVLSGSPFAVTLLNCDHCDERHPHALIRDGVSKILYGLECMGCNETAFWHDGGDMLLHIRRQLPEDGFDLGVIGI